MDNQQQPSQPIPQPEQRSAFALSVLVRLVLEAVVKGVTEAIIDDAW